MLNSKYSYKKYFKVYINFCIEFFVSFLDKVEIITNNNYLPTNEDILKSRKITNGIKEVTFKIKVWFK